MKQNRHDSSDKVELVLLKNTDQKRQPSEENETGKLFYAAQIFENWLFTLKWHKLGVQYQECPGYTHR